MSKDYSVKMTCHTCQKVTIHDRRIKDLGFVHKANGKVEQARANVYVCRVCGNQS